MIIQCPNCKSAQMTKGRAEFPCRICGTLLTDPRICPDNKISSCWVRLDEVIRIAKNHGVYNEMKEVLTLNTKEDGNYAESNYEETDILE